jgi:hydrogenase maturation protease
MPIKIIGIGSAYGDDQLGWQLIANLQRKLPQLELICANPYNLLSHLTNAQPLILIDAIQANLPLGQICWWENPNPQIIPTKTFSSHSLDLSNILQLAYNLGQLPQQWILSGIVANPNQIIFNAKLSPEVLASMPILLNLLENKIQMLQKNSV